MLEEMLISSSRQRQGGGGGDKTFQTLPGVRSQHLHQIDVLETGGHELLPGDHSVGVDVHLLEYIRGSLFCCV